MISTTDILILAIIAVLMLLAGMVLVRNKKRGRSMCGCCSAQSGNACSGGCTHCPYSHK